MVNIISFTSPSGLPDTGKRFDPISGSCNMDRTKQTELKQMGVTVFKELYGSLAATDATCWMWHQMPHVDVASIHMKKQVHNLGIKLLFIYTLNTSVY